MKQPISSLENLADMMIWPTLAIRHFPLSYFYIHGLREATRFTEI